MFTGLGIIFDTYANERHSYGFPRVLAVNLDGHTKYDLGNDGDSQALGACSVNFRRTNVATKFKLTYVKGDFLDLKIQYKAWDEWTDCFTIPGITLPSNPFIGFSALTGDVSDNHEYVSSHSHPWAALTICDSIISVTTYSAILSSEDQPKNNLKKTAGSWRLSKSDHYSTANGGFFWRLFSFLFKLGLFVGLCAGLWYGYQEYLRRQRYGGLGLGGLGSPAPGSAFGMGSRPSSPYPNLGSAGLGSGLSAGPMSSGFGGMRSAGLRPVSPMSANYANKRLWVGSVLGWYAEIRFVASRCSINPSVDLCSGLAVIILNRPSYNEAMLSVPSQSNASFSISSPLDGFD